MGFSRRPGQAAQTAVWGSRAEKSELSPLDAQGGEIPTRSLSGRIKDNGRRYINLFKPVRLSGQSQACTKDRAAPSDSQTPASIGLAAFSTTISRRFTMTDFPAVSSSNENNQPSDLNKVPSYESHAKYPGSNVLESLRHSAFVQGEPLRDNTYRDGEPRSSINSQLSLDPEGSIKKKRQRIVDRVKGYTARGWDRVLSPTPGGSGSSGSGILLGVGSQYDGTNKPGTSPSQANRGDSERQGPSYGMGSNVRSHGQNRNSVSRSLWPSTLRRISNGAIPQEDHVLPDDPSEPDYSLRLSTDSALRSVSVVDSVFSRPSSTVSTVTSWESTGRLSSHSRRLLRKRNASFSSIVSNNRASSGQRPEGDPEQAVPPVPPVPTVSPAVNAQRIRSIDSWVACLNPSVSDQVTAAGWVAQQRRAKKGRISEIPQEDEPDELDGKQHANELSPDTCADNDLETAREPALSTIDEGHSDAGCSTNEAIPLQFQLTGDKGNHGLLSIRRNPSTGYGSCSGTETSEVSKQPSMTPATSIGEQPDLEDPDGHENSEDDESMSNLTDETDESFYDAFVATSLDSSLLPAAITLKDHIASLVSARVTDWVRSCCSGQVSGEGLPGSASGADFGSGGQDGSTARDGAGKKRGFDESNPGGSGRGNGDDQEKRRKMEAELTKAEVLKLESNLACPFLKVHPNRKWPRCQKCFSSVHRIKEHLYRAHELPLRCDRCFKTFKEEKELKQHRRQVIQCDLIEPSDEMLLGIDGDTIRKLRARTGARNGTQEEKWKHMFKIIFPDVRETDIPSPYYDIQALEIPISPEVRAQYRRFLRQEIPPRVVRSLTRNLNEIPEVRDNPHFSERKLSEVVLRAVWDAFDDVLPSLVPQSAPPETPYDGISKLSVRTQTPQEPASTPVSQSTQSVNISMSGASQTSPSLPEITPPEEPMYVDNNAGLSNWPDDPILSADALNLFPGGFPEYQMDATEPGNLVSEPLPDVSQSRNHVSLSPLQFDALGNYLDDDDGVMSLHFLNDQTFNYTDPSSQPHN